jgi:hypothetical protein
MLVEVVAGNDRTLLVGATTVEAQPLAAWSAVALALDQAVVDTTNSAIVRELERVPDVAAVYVTEDEERVLHVFTVVAKHTNEVFDRILLAEARIEKRLKDRVLHFHVRAHQGRSPQSAVPLTSEPIYVR